jgi:hypothetical protein
MAELAREHVRKMVDKREQDSPRIEVGAGAVEIGFTAA